MEQAILNLTKIADRQLRRMDRLESTVKALIQSQAALLGAMGLEDHDLAKRLEALHEHLENL